MCYFWILWDELFYRFFFAVSIYHHLSIKHNSVENSTLEYYCTRSCLGWHTQNSQSLPCTRFAFCQRSGFSSSSRRNIVKVHFCTLNLITTVSVVWIELKRKCAEIFVNWIVSQIVFLCWTMHEKLLYRENLQYKKLSGKSNITSSYWWNCCFLNEKGNK